MGELVVVNPSQLLIPGSRSFFLFQIAFTFVTVPFSFYNVCYHSEWFSLQLLKYRFVLFVCYIADGKLQNEMYHDTRFKTVLSLKHIQMGPRVGQQIWGSVNQDNFTRRRVSNITTGKLPKLKCDIA